MYVLYFFICLVACFIGAISGIGGGVIIKPLIDSFSNMTANQISFLSGVTVLIMAFISLNKNIKNNIKNNININFKIVLFLAFGSALGGFFGKYIFQKVYLFFENSKISFIQSFILLLINILILLYILNKNKIKTYNIKNKFVCFILGLGLGIISSFLGIGGGPLNIALLYICFSINSKETALCSLFIVFVSQMVSTVTTIFNKIPYFDINILIFMCFGAILGAIIGSRFSKKMNNEKTEKFFLKVLIFLIFLNIYNMFKFYKILIGE